AAADELAGAVLDGADDQRVKHHDVGHGEEGDQAAADLPRNGRATFGDLEERVEAVCSLLGGGPGAGGVGLGRGHDRIVPGTADNWRALTESVTHTCGSR